MAAAEEFSVYRHIGDYLREASVLIFVFGFLDPLIPETGAEVSLKDRLFGLPGAWVGSVLVVSVAFLTVGILIEWLRTR